MENWDIIKFTSNGNIFQSQLNANYEDASNKFSQEIHESKFEY